MHDNYHISSTFPVSNAVTMDACSIQRECRCYFCLLIFIKELQLQLWRYCVEFLLREFLAFDLVRIEAAAM